MIDPHKFKDESVKKSLRGEVLGLINNKQRGESYRLFKDLEEALSGAAGLSEEDRKFYQKQKAYLGLAALPLLDESEIRYLIREHREELKNAPLSFSEQVKFALLDLPEGERKRWQERIKAILEEPPKPPLSAPLPASKPVPPASLANEARRDGPLKASQPPIQKARSEPKEKIKPPMEIPASRPLRPKKPLVSDVVPVSRLMGPIDELRSLTLKDFRRLGDNPQAIKNELEEKISLLEEESFSEKIKGIKAWRSSPVYQNYLEIGQISISEGKSISQVIKELTAQGRPTLTLEEFDVIGDLSEELRF